MGEVEEINFFCVSKAFSLPRV